MKTYCVATAIIQDEERYFIAKRANSKKIAPGLWEFVTGFVEDHEAAEDTIVREISEEIGAKGKVIRGLDIFEMNNGSERWIVLPFLASVSPAEIKLNPREHSACEWVTWKELLQIPSHEFRYDFERLRIALEQGGALV